MLLLLAHHDKQDLRFSQREFSVIIGQLSSQSQRVGLFDLEFRHVGVEWSTHRRNGPRGQTKTVAIQVIKEQKFDGDTGLVRYSGGI